MSDFSVRDIPGLDMLQREIQRTTGKLNQSITNAAAYTPDDATLWAGDPPTTVSEALDRIAAFIKNEHGGSDL